MISYYISSVGQSIPSMAVCGAGAAALLTPLYGDILVTALVKLKYDRCSCMLHYPARLMNLYQLEAMLKRRRLMTIISRQFV